MAYDLGHHIIMRAYDGQDPNGSPTGTLDDVFDKSFMIRHNAPGSAEFKLNRHDSDRTITQPDAYIRCYLDSVDNDPVFAFWVTESSDVVLAPGEDGAEVMQKSGEGAMAYMADGIVWYEDVTGNDAATPGDNDDMWHWVSVHPGGILVRMIEEAVARGCYPDLTYDFTRTTDSNGDPWTVTIDDFQLQVGTDLLTLMGYLQTMGLVFVMDHDLTLHAYEATSYGTDLSGSVVFTKGIDISETADRHQVSAPARSTVLVKGARSDNGETAWVEADSVAGLAETGRRKEGFFDAQETTHFSVLQNIGLEEIYQKLRLKVGPTNLVVLPLDTQKPLEDYNVGDSVTVDVPGIWNTDVKPITYIAFYQRSNDEYDVAVGFEDAPAMRSLANTGPDGQPVGPPPINTQACCPDDGPFVPPGTDEDCGLAAAVTLHIGSHAAFDEPDPPDHNFAYSSDEGVTVNLQTGFQYRELVTVVFNDPTVGSPATLDANPFVYLAYPTGGTPANPPGPSGALVDAPTWAWSVGGVGDDGIDTASNGAFPSGYATGATFASPWKQFDGPDVVADIIARGVPVSGFHGFNMVLDVRIEVRNGDGSAIDCGGDTTQTSPNEGQRTTEQAVGSGTTRFTNFPYTPGSLEVWISGVRVTVVETDPTTGEFELPFDPGSSPVIVRYQGTSDHTPTGAGNIPPTPGVYPIPDELLPANLGLPWFDVKEDFGGTGDGTTDDTEAIQDAIDAAEAAGGGVVYFRKGVYKVSGALQDGSRGNAQLLLPSVDYVSGEQISIVLLGEIPPPPIFSVIGATPLPDEHVVIKGTLTSVSGTSPSLLGGWGPDTALDFTFIQARIENIAFRLPEDPVYSALNLSHVAGVDLDNVVCDVSDYQIQGITEPTTSTSTGIILPAINNGAYTRLGAVNVAGYYTGYRAGEHTYGQQVTAWGCKVALETNAGYHAIHFDRFMAVHCERGIKATGGTAYLSIDQFNVEHAASGWWVTDYDVDDASDYLVGRAEWKVTLAGVGHDSTWTVNGATNFLMNEMGTSSGSFSGDAVDVAISDAGGYFTATDVEAALQESAADIAALQAAPAAGAGHTHIAYEQHLSNGSTTTYTLDNSFETGSVIAWNVTTLARLDVTETAPDQATVSAAGSSGDKIVFDYAATVV